jgi:hypothetical protein
MPYIKPEVRKQIDALIEQFTDGLRDATEVNNGTANYIITRILLRFLRPENGWNYDSLSDVIKTLECAKLEIYRRMLTPYEAVKIFENEDVPEFNIFDELEEKSLNNETNIDPLTALYNSMLIGEPTS